jgi:hypothetical protein
MGLLTIGVFAKASRLSPKALRLYDELGLLTPARVDPVTGYRRYARTGFSETGSPPLARRGRVQGAVQADQLRFTSARAERTVALTLY